MIYGFSNTLRSLSLTTTGRSPCQLPRTSTLLSLHDASGFMTDLGNLRPTFYNKAWQTAACGIDEKGMRGSQEGRKKGTRRAHRLPGLP